MMGVEPSGVSDRCHLPNPHAQNQVESFPTGCWFDPAGDYTYIRNRATPGCPSRDGVGKVRILFVTRDLKRNLPESYF